MSTPGKWRNAAPRKMFSFLHRNLEESYYNNDNSGLALALPYWLTPFCCHCEMIRLCMKVSVRLSCRKLSSVRHYELKPCGSPRNRHCPWKTLSSPRWWNFKEIPRMLGMNAEVKTLVILPVGPAYSSQFREISLGGERHRCVSLCQHEGSLSCKHAALNVVFFVSCK